MLATAGSSLAQLQPGKLPLAWTSDAYANCLEAPDWLIHEYNDELYILRQSGCTNYEKPFLYLLFGKDRALLQDTGAGKPDTARVVQSLMAKWAKARNREPLPLIVVHSHGHGDHTAGDAGFAGQPKVELVPATVPAIQKALGIEEWPAGIGQIDLGERSVDVIPIPGHDAASIALYDRKTGVLLTGDTVYPGRLYLSDAGEFSRSIDRLVEFTRTRPVAHILGTHIEQSRTPFSDYVVGTTYQPSEHVLELGRGHLLELKEALAASGGKPVRVALRDLTIVPRGTNPVPFVPANFDVPTRYQTSKYSLVPLGPDLASHDYQAYMSSIEHLQKTFTGGGWPNQDITMADALKDVEGEISRFRARTSFTYAVLSPDGREELGCVYIRPSNKAGYDAQVAIWVTKKKFDEGFDGELFRDMKTWIPANWPFKTIGYPKREIAQVAWEALPNKP